MIRQAVIADPGWRLVVADADQMEPRVLAAISRDRGLMEVAGHDGDLYKALSDRAFSGDREHAKLALLGAIYGQTSGDGLKNLAALRRRFPLLAVAYVDDAARAGEEGRVVRTWLGHTSPPVVSAGQDEEARASPRRTRRAPVTPKAPPGPGAAQHRPGGASPATSWCRAARPTGRCCSWPGCAGRSSSGDCGRSWCSSSTTR
ncbi:hypothetical protein SBADM41S_10333 [Streptomyces badius]